MVQPYEKRLASPILGSVTTFLFTYLLTTKRWQTETIVCLEIIMATTNITTATAYNFGNVLAGLVKSYATTSQLKKDYSNLVNLYGKDEALRLVKAYKSAKEAEVSAKADEARSQLTLSGLMEYAFDRLDLKKKNGALARLQAMGGAERAEAWETFLAKYYPHTMTGGKPAIPVWYVRKYEDQTEASEVYKVYEPLAITTENAIKVLNKALANLEKGAAKVWSTGKERKGWTVAHTAGAIAEAREASIKKEIIKNEEGEIISDRYIIVRGEKRDFPDGLCISEEFIACKEALRSLNASEE